MNDIVSEYCELAEQGVLFEDVRLARLRERMTDADVIQVKARLVSVQLEQRILAKASEALGLGVSNHDEMVAWIEKELRAERPPRAPPMRIEHEFLRVVEDHPGEFAVYDDSMPKTEEYYYGLCAYGFASRADAELYVAELLIDAQASAPISKTRQ